VRERIRAWAGNPTAGEVATGTAIGLVAIVLTVFVIAQAVDRVSVMLFVLLMVFEVASTAVAIRHLSATRRRRV
jgi:hypothetical protein